jgi:hypothetical protein
MLTHYSPKLLAFLLALLIGGGLIAAKEPTGPKQYDYVSLVQQYNIVYVTQGTAKFERTKVDSEGGSKSYNLEPLFVKVGEFEAQGYELVNSNIFAESAGQSYSYVLLRRPK